MRGGGGGGGASGTDHSLLLLGHPGSLAQTQLLPVPTGAQDRLYFFLHELTQLVH